VNGKDNFTPRHGSPLFFPEDPEDGFQGNRVSRRKFLKRSGSATASTFLGWSALQQNIRAQDPTGGETPPPDESTPEEEECEWDDAWVEWKLPLEIDVKKFVDDLWTDNPTGDSGDTVQELYSTKTDLQNDLYGNPQVIKIPIEITQKVEWKECIFKDGQGKVDKTRQPEKFKNLSWTYGGSPAEGVEFKAAGGVLDKLTGKVGYHISIQGHNMGGPGNPKDRWILGGMVVYAHPAAYSPGITGSSASPLYYPGGVGQDDYDENIHKARAVFTKPPQDPLFDCQELKATGKWEGTGHPDPKKSGVSELMVLHTSQNIRVRFYVKLSDGTIITVNENINDPKAAFVGLQAGERQPIR